MQGLIIIGTFCIGTFVGVLTTCLIVGGKNKLNMTDLNKLINVLSKSSAEYSVIEVEGVNENDYPVLTKIMTVSDCCGCSVDLFFDVNDMIV